MKTWLPPVLLASLLSAGCAHTRFDNLSRQPVSFTPDLGTDREYKVVRRVDNDYRRTWILFYLVPVGSDGSDMVARSAAGGDGMANLRITSQFDVVDILVTNLTLGLFCTRSVNIQGDVVEFE